MRCTKREFKMNYFRVYTYYWSLYRESRIYPRVSTWKFRRLELTMYFTTIIQYFAFLYRLNSLSTECLRNAN